MIITKKTYRPLIIGSLLSCVIPGMAQASGFALIENSASGQGNAYAGAAAHTNDASTIFFNPAGMMRLEGDQISLAGHFISPDATFTDNGSTTGPGVPGQPPLVGTDDDGGANAFVPNFYWVKTIDNQMKFGLGVQTLFGLATEYDRNWVGRYHAVETDLKTINFNPSIAYQVNDQLSIGGGVNVVYGDIVFSNAIDFGAVCLGIFGATSGAVGGACASPQNFDGFADLTGDNLSDPAFGFNVGLQYALNPDTTFGASFRSEIDLDFEGTADFTVPAAVVTAVGGAPGFIGTGQFIDTGIKAGVTLPASLALSVASKSGKITYLADITWTGWSSFDELRIIFDNTAQSEALTTENWDDTFRYSVGLDYQYNNKMVLRTGLAYDETPIPSAENRTARIPGNDRTWLSFGLSYTIDEQSSVDVGYSHLFIDDTTINNTLESQSSLAPVVNATLTGSYEAAVDIISVQWNNKF